MTGRNKNGKRPDYEFDYDEKFIRGRKKGDGAFEKIADAVIPMKGDRAGEFIRKIVFLLSFACVILLLIMIVLNLNESINGDGLAKSSKINPESEIFGRVDIRDSHDAVSEKAPIPEVLDEYIELYERNSDLVGWVKIDGTEIDYPVLQAEDNDYYLFKDFDKNYSIYGSIYADYHVPITAESRPNNTVLYGHNINVGTYFAKLTRYFPQINGYGYYSSHPTVQFDTIYEQGAYKIFGAIFINTQERHGEVYDYYRKRTFPDKEAFYDFVGNIMDRSVFYTGVDLEYGDEFLTLSTCFYPLGENVDTRFVVFARRVRAGESEEVDVQQYYVNPSPLFFDYWYNVQGGSWQGRSWDTSKVKGFDEFVAENPDSAIALQGA